MVPLTRAALRGYGPRLCVDGAVASKQHTNWTCGYENLAAIVRTLRGAGDYGDNDDYNDYNDGAGAGGGGGAGTGARLMPGASWLRAALPSRLDPRALQERIAAAWRAGYDPRGARQVGE